MPAAKRRQQWATPLQAQLACPVLTPVHSQLVCRRGPFPVRRRGSGGDGTRRPLRSQRPWVRALIRNKDGVRAVWLEHLLWCIPVIVWVKIVCGIPLWIYVLTMAIPGTSLPKVSQFKQGLSRIRPLVGWRWRNRRAKAQRAVLSAVG